MVCRWFHELAHEKKNKRGAKEGGCCNLEAVKAYIKRTLIQKRANSPKET